MILILCLSLTLASLSQTVPECKMWQECRDQALAAAAAADFERFHDLAWRAAQRGPKNDPALMTLVARAQSLSGRPHDALVMLQRLAAMGLVTDAADHPDFGRVRALPGWAELERQIAAIAAPLPAPPSKAGAPRDPPAARHAPRAARPGEAAAKADADPPAAAATPKAVGAGGSDALAFTTPPFQPAGLAYDAVSSRFLVGNRGDHRVSVVGERSGRIVTLSGGAPGFGEVAAIAIDPREGDLWVASTPPGAASVSTLHKLQLISGRLLTTIPLPPAPSGSRIVDLVVSEQGSVVALDVASGRVLKLPPRGSTLETVTSADLSRARSVAPARTLTYVALDEGLAALDVGGKLAALKAPSGVDLAGFDVVRWRPGGLIGVQRTDGGRRLARVVLDRSGLGVRRVEILDSPDGMQVLPSLALTADEVYYLAQRTSAAETRQMVIRRVPLR